MALRSAGSRPTNQLTNSNNFQGQSGRSTIFTNQSQSSEISSPLPQHEQPMKYYGDFRRFKVLRQLLYVVFVILSLLLFFAILLSLSGKKQVRVSAQNAQRSWSIPDAQLQWPKAKTRRAEWEAPIKEDETNWIGRQKMRNKLANGAFWWDERAEQYVTSKLEASQFPEDCSKTHWIAKSDMTSGLLATTHIFQFPLFFSMMRGFTLLPITNPHDDQTSFLKGCGPGLANRNLRCFYNITHCDPREDSARMKKILSQDQEGQRTTWDELLMESDDFFATGGPNVVNALRLGAWDTDTCINSTTFASFLEAFDYSKLSLWHEMGRHGKTGIRRAPNQQKDECPVYQDPTATRRVDMVITSLLSSWMLSRVSNDVKLVADQIMSRYMNSSGKPLWKSPVLAIQIQHDDKTLDPYHLMENYAEIMKQMENDYDFQWPSIFIISNLGPAMESLITTIIGQENSSSPQVANQLLESPPKGEQHSKSPQEVERFLMHDWTANHHLIKSKSNNFKEDVSKDKESEIQTNLLATLYIVKNIADHAIVTYSSNVGTFIGEIMAAKHRLAFVHRESPVTTAFDVEWLSLERTKLQRGIDTF